MRVSQGIPRGRKVDLYHPELWDDHEEVIIYTREEFKRTYTLMKDEIDFINKLDFSRYQCKNRDLVGHWPRIMDHVHILASGMNSLLSDKPLQAYLDSYIYSKAKAREDKPSDPVGEISAESLGVSWL